MAMRTTTTVVDKSNWANATFEKAPTTVPVLEQFILRCLQSGVTGNIESKPGYGKTQTVKAFARKHLPHGRVVVLSGPAMTSDDITMEAPKLVIDESGENTLVLEPAIYEQLQKQYLPDGSLQPFIIVIDDPNQSVNKAAANLTMQITNSGSVNTVDLKDNGLIGVFLLNNDSLEDTNSVTTDLASLDRLVSITLSPNDTGWRWALAEKYAAVDLTEVFATWAEMPLQVRDQVSPRVLDHVIQALLLGWPGEVGLPVMPNGERRKLVVSDDTGKVVADRTDEFITRVADAIGAPNPERVDDPVAKLVSDSIEHGLTSLIIGPPGGGKTAKVLKGIEEKIDGDPRQFYFSIPTTDPERFTLPLPKNGTIHQVLTEALKTNTPKVLVCDEANRGGQHIQSRLMELNQEWTVAGQQVPGLKAVINIENPPYHMGRKMTVNRRNRAQTERFTLNVILNDADISAGDWILNELPKLWADQVIRWKQITREMPADEAGETAVREDAVTDGRRVAELVLEWWKEDLDDAGRQWVTNRGKERLIRWILAGGDPEQALIRIAPGERAPVQLAALRARLAERPLTGLRQLIQDKDTWIEKLTVAEDALIEAEVQAILRGEDHTQVPNPEEGSEYTDQVQHVVMRAELTQLEENREVLTEIWSYMPRRHSMAALRGSGQQDKTKFWIAMVPAAKDIREPRRTEKRNARLVELGAEPLAS